MAFEINVTEVRILFRGARRMRRVGFVLACLLLPVKVVRAQETVTYYHTDGTGSVRLTTNQSGNVVAQYDYLPFGEPCGSCVTPAPTPQTRQFAGQEKDQDNGL